MNNIINSAGMPISTHFPICTKKLKKLNIENTSEVPPKQAISTAERLSAKDDK